MSLKEFNDRANEKNKRTEYLQFRTISIKII
jgi:hypothetical protein